jgi:hypothetical protein
VPKPIAIGVLGAALSRIAAQLPAMSAVGGAPASLVEASADDTAGVCD